MILAAFWECSLGLGGMRLGEVGFGLNGLAQDSVALRKALEPELGPNGR